MKWCKDRGQAQSRRDPAYLALGCDSVRGHRLALVSRGPGLSGSPGTQVRGPRGAGWGRETTKLVVSTGTGPLQHRGPGWGAVPPFILQLSPEAPLRVLR